MHICTFDKYLATALCLIQWMRKPVCFLQTDRERVILFSLHVGWGLCFCERRPGCVCLSEGKKEWKKCVFHGSEADIFTDCLVVWAFWPLNTWITHFRSVRSVHVDIPAVCLCACPCAPVFACLCRTDEIASPPPLPPPPPNVISLPLGPWQTHQTGRK